MRWGWKGQGGGGIGQWYDEGYCNFNGPFSTGYVLTELGDKKVDARFNINALFLYSPLSISSFPL